MLIGPVAPKCFVCWVRISLDLFVLLRFACSCLSLFLSFPPSVLSLTILLRRLSSTSSVLSLPSRTSLRSRPLLYAKSTLAFVALFPRTVITETRSGIVHTSHQSSHSFSEVELLKPHTSQTQHIEKQRQTRCISQSTPWCWPPLQLAKHMLHPSATSTRPSTATHASTTMSSSKPSAPMYAW